MLLQRPDLIDLDTQIVVADAIVKMSQYVTDTADRCFERLEPVFKWIVARETTIFQEQERIQRLYVPLSHAIKCYRDASHYIPIGNTIIGR